jgi:light-regulated signal transduction histidine kinase (bacteriophytochrome)
MSYHALQQHCTNIAPLPYNRPSVMTESAEVSDTDTLEHPATALIARLEARNARLQQAVRAANQEIDALTFSIAHDLRTPLMHIDGFAQLLQTSTGVVLDRENRDHLERIIGAARTMSDLIGALVEYSRVNSAELVMTEVDLEDVLEEALDLVRPWSNGRNIQWQRTRLPTIRADENLLRQVLVALVSNAVKYTRPRDPAIIEIGTRPEQAREVTVFVRDNGVGFDPKYAGRLFTPFQRLHSADAFRGIGMGLAKVRRILSRHGGRVWAEAQVGEGAAFFFSVPNDTDE